jgi:hypothetical protein
MIRRGGGLVPPPLLIFEVNMGSHHYPYMNKRAVAFNMSKGPGDLIFQGLLDGLSSEELVFLQKNSDLIKRVRAIAEMSVIEILREFREEYDLDVEQQGDGDFWVSTEKLEDAIPDWFPSDHVGWFKKPGDFQEWAQKFLMQDVRINIWVRYLEHKKKTQASAACVGMYL